MAVKVTKSGSEYERKRQEGADYNHDVTAADKVLGGTLELNYDHVGREPLLQTRRFGEAV